MSANTHFWLYLTQIFLEWEIFQVEVVDKTKTHIFMFSNFFFFENSTIY